MGIFDSLFGNDDTDERENQMPDGPEEVNTTAVRLKSGLKKALLWGGIAALALTGVGAFMGFTAMTAAFSGGWITSLLAAVGVGSTVAAVGTSGLAVGATAVIGGISALAGTVGFALGAMDDAPVREAEADVERDFRRQRARMIEKQHEEMMLRRQEIQNQRQMAMMGMGDSVPPQTLPGGPAMGPGMGMRQG